MKTIRASSGPFSERPFYEDAEVERICTDALREVKLYPDRPEPIRIERFITKRFGVTAEYAPLPDGLLGYTEFGPRGVKAIYVQASLVEAGTNAAERLANSTLAHEGGHGLLHAHLYVLGAPNPTLFGHDANCTATKILCRDGVPGRTKSPSRGYDGRWWEYQANQAMGALLLPKPLVSQCLDGFVVNRGSFGRSVLQESRRAEAVRQVSEVFEVNPIVAAIRLAGMYPDERGQLTI